MGESQPRLYTELAGWWQLVSLTEDYAEEAAFFRELFRAESASTILELGSGGGNVAWFEKLPSGAALDPKVFAVLAGDSTQFELRAGGVCWLKSPVSMSDFRLPGTS